MAVATNNKLVSDVSFNPETSIFQSNIKPSRFSKLSFPFQMTFISGRVMGYKFMGEHVDWCSLPEAKKSLVISNLQSYDWSLHL